MLKFNTNCAHSTGRMLRFHAQHFPDFHSPDPAIRKLKGDASNAVCASTIAPVVCSFHLSQSVLTTSLTV